MVENSAKQRDQDFVDAENKRLIFILPMKAEMYVHCYGVEVVLFSLFIGVLFTVCGGMTLKMQSQV